MHDDEESTGKHSRVGKDLEIKTSGQLQMQTAKAEGYRSTLMHFRRTSYGIYVPRACA